MRSVKAKSLQPNAGIIQEEFHLLLAFLVAEKPLTHFSGSKLPDT